MSNNPFNTDFFAYQKWDNFIPTAFNGGINLSQQYLMVGSIFPNSINCIKPKTNSNTQVLQKEHLLLSKDL